MSRTEARALAGIFAAAFLLRAGAAVLTDKRPLFPPFYYADARLIERLVADTLAAEREGRASPFKGAQGRLLQVRTQAAIYRLLGPSPLAMKLLNGLLGALACAVLGAAFLPVFGPGPALTAAALCAAWPSNVFFTSQNLKEAPANLLAYLSIWGLTTLLAGRRLRPAAASLVAAGAVLALTAGALYRAPTLLVLVASMALICAWTLAVDRKLPSIWALCLAAALAAPALYGPASRLLATRWLGAEGARDPDLRAQLIPSSWLDGQRPLSPRGLTEFRRSQLEVDRQRALLDDGREIATQLFPQARFESWLDVAAFLPKGVFHALFMPLPGLYPLEGKIGRALAGAENILLLALSALGLWGAVCGPKTSSRALLLLFFGGAAAGAGLLEPDLGSAARHKLLFLPMLFPFAAEALRRSAARRSTDP